MNKQIAIIMSLYKNDKLIFVKQSIDSLLRQSYSSFKLFIQFDGDIDNAVEYYIKNIEDSRIEIKERTENKGLAYSLNELLNIVLNLNYDYIARMDADDISDLDRLKKQIEFLEDNKDIDCVGTWAIEINSNNEEFFKKQMPVSNEECFRLFKRRDCLIHPTVMFRKTYFEKAGLYPEDTYFAEDTMMWAKGFVSGCRFANIPEYLFMFRLDDNFFERRRGWKHAQSIFKLRKRVNRLLGFSWKEDMYAFLYAIAKLMPEFILNLIYRKAR